MLHEITLQVSCSAVWDVPCPESCPCRCSSQAGCCQNQCWWASRESLRAAQSWCWGLTTCEVKLSNDKKEQLYMNKKPHKMSAIFSIVFSLTGAGDDSKNIFVQAGVQKGAGPGRCHQGVGKKWIFSSILRKNRTTFKWNLQTSRLISA